jgi:hydrogenase expression/formation protein HypC
MCLGVPGQIVEVTDPQIATVNVRGTHRTINCQLLTGAGEALAAGDWVVIHLGFAVDRIDEAEAKEVLGFLEDPTADLPDRGGRETS